MARNVESHFSKLPEAEIGRSRFDRSSTHKTTFNAGKLIPIYVDEVLPGDTFSMDVSSLVRMSTPIFPVMDNAYLDTYFFFVPNRLLWEHWKEFNGENNTSRWVQPVEYSVPTVISPGGFNEDPSEPGHGWNKGSVADYFGIPTKVQGLNVNALPFRAYALIWNEWFRDQNIMLPAEFYRDDSSRIGVIASSSDINTARLTAHLGGDLLPVCRYHDYFSSALPAPQKGPAVSLPFESGVIPVYSLQKTGPYGDTGSGYENFSELEVDYESYTSGPLSFGDESGHFATDGGLFVKYGVTASDGSAQGSPVNLVYPRNLYAVPGDSFAPTINSLRQAFQLQKLFEKDARGGTRYTEILKMHFGVDSPDSRLQRPEYLGGKRIPINIDQVLQTSSTDNVSPQGNTAAYSLTVDVDSAFTKSFTEHGFIIGLCCVRTDHTYQQGLERMWSRERRFDYYWPALANIGEQAILNKELFAKDAQATGDNVAIFYNEEAFGYQEAWAEYRYKPSRVSGAFRSNYSGTLDSWHYADYYNPDVDNEVNLSAEWMQEVPYNIDRTLAVPSAVEDQFIADFYFKCDCVRPMPLYSIPGLIDHH